MAGLAPSVEAHRDDVERRWRRRRGAAGAIAIARLRDRERQDGHGGIGREVDGIGRLLVGETVVDDAADDPWAGLAVPALDEGVQVVLRGERLGHAHVLAEQTDAPDPPVAAGLGELMGVQREMRTMKAADAHVEDARLEPAALVGRHRHPAGGDVGQGPLAQRDRRPRAAVAHQEHDKHRDINISSLDSC